MTYFGSQLNIKFSSWVVSFSISFKIWTASSTLCKFRLSFLNDKSQNWRNETSRRGQALLSFEKIWKSHLSQVETMYRWHYDHPQSLKLWMLQKPWKPCAALFPTCTGTWAILFWRASLKRVARDSDKSQEQFIAPLALTKLACELRSEFLYYKKIDWLKGFFKKRQITYD